VLIKYIRARWTTYNWISIWIWNSSFKWWRFCLRSFKSRGFMTKQKPYQYCVPLWWLQTRCSWTDSLVSTALSCDSHTHWCVNTGQRCRALLHTLARLWPASCSLCMLREAAERAGWDKWRLYKNITVYRFGTFSIWFIPPCSFVASRINAVPNTAVARCCVFEANLPVRRQHSV